MTRARELAELGSIYDNQSLGHRNMVYNGAMNVAQRGSSSTGLGATSGYYTVDRFATNFNSTSGRLTMTQESITDLAGFSKALKIACTTADTSLGAAEYFTIAQVFEGQDCQRLKKGTSDAEQITVSFYVKGNAAATYALELQDQSSREISQQFSVTTSWNRVVLTFIADTSGAITNTNTFGLGISFWLAAGSNFNSGDSADLNTTWDAVGATAGSRAAGISNFFDSTSRTLFITGLQMEIGSQATNFEYIPFGEELAKCQRYYFETPGYTAGNAGTSADVQWYHTYTKAANAWEWSSSEFPVQMRAAPTATCQDGSTDGKIGHWTSSGGGSTQGHNPWQVLAKSNRIVVNEYATSGIYGFYYNYKVDAEL